MFQICARRVMGGVMLVNGVRPWTESKDRLRELFLQSFDDSLHQYAVRRADVAELLLFLFADEIVLPFMFWHIVIHR